MLESHTIKINGVKAPEWLRITGVTFPVFPELHHKERSIVRRYGNVDGGIEINGFPPISLDVVILNGESNLHSRAQDLKSWITGGNIRDQVKLQFTEEEDYYYTVRVVNSVALNDLIVAGTGTIALKSSDGVKYKDSVDRLSGSGERIVLTYSGLEKTPLKLNLTVLEDTENITVTHVNTGSQINLMRYFNNGATVGIDNEKNIITVNEQNDMNSLAISSRWIYLEQGTNILEFSNEFDYELEYRERH